MSIALYKKGATHEIKGITCEIGTFDASELDSLLKEGWHTDPTDLKIEVIDAIQEQNRKGTDIKSNDEIVKPKKGKKGKR